MAGGKCDRSPSGRGFKIDTVLRPSLVPRAAYLNPVLVILSVLRGVHLMGLVGITYGPRCRRVFREPTLRSRHKKEFWAGV